MWQVLVCFRKFGCYFDNNMECYLFFFFLQPFQLSNTQTIFATCDIMTKVYEKLGESSDELIADSSFRNTVEKADGLIKVFHLFS